MANLSLPSVASAGRSALYKVFYSANLTHLPFIDYSNSCVNYSPAWALPSSTVQEGYL